jgi:exopolysaccharide biosynthesis polyprenyl glycosylphosphotransferase
MSQRFPIEVDQLGAAPAALQRPGSDAAVRTWLRVVSRRYAARDSAVRRLLAVSDLVAVTIAMGLSFLLVTSHPVEFVWGLVVLPLWIVVFMAYGLYGRDLKRISHQTLDDLPSIFHAVVVGCLLLLACYRFFPVEGIWLGPLAVFAVLAIVSVTALRALARRFAVSVLGPERVVLLGEGSEISVLARKLEANGRQGARSVGLIPLSGSEAGANGGSGKKTPALPDLSAMVSRHRVERIVVARKDFDGGALFELLNSARELGVKVSVLPQLFAALGPSVEIDDVGGIAVLGINPPVLSRSSRFVKRGMDIAGVVTLLILTAPLLAVIAIAIRLDSAGPVLFRQERIGLWGRRFRLLKFRTMTIDAELLRASLLAKSKDPGWLHLDDDPRVTRVGRLLRRSSLDELPQLWNVLKGEMSLVGPRPIVPSEDRQLDGWRRSRIDIAPGLTGLWQVMGRTSIPFEEMIRLDFLYVTNWTLWTDIRLVLRTVPAVLRRKGAN